MYKNFTISNFFIIIKGVMLVQYAFEYIPFCVCVQKYTHNSFIEKYFMLYYEYIVAYQVN